MRMSNIKFKRVDEDMPGIANETNAVIEFLLSHHDYLIPFSKILTNMPTNFVDNPRFSKELESYLMDEFAANKYIYEKSYELKEVKKLVSMLTSYFSFYDDYYLHVFIKNNSRYRVSNNLPQGLQREAFGRLKGYLFECLVCGLLAPYYSKAGCLFETGCVVFINKKEISVVHNKIHRKTIDVVGIDDSWSGNMLECKVQPFRVDELTVKYSTYLKAELENNGYTKINVGFVTAGSKDMLKFKILQQLNTLNIQDTELLAYDVNDLCIFSNCAVLPSKMETTN